MFNPGHRLIFKMRHEQREKDRRAADDASTDISPNPRNSYEEADGGYCLEDNETVTLASPLIDHDQPNSTPS